MKNCTCRISALQEWQRDRRLRGGLKGTDQQESDLPASETTGEALQGARSPVLGSQVQERCDLGRECSDGL